MPGVFICDRVYIILVNWNGWRDTIECLESLKGIDYASCRIVVCDNDSDDDSVGRIRGWAAQQRLSCAEYRRSEGEVGGVPGVDPWLVLIRNEDNLGFAGGNNVGMRYALAQGDVGYCWLLNNDTVVEPDTLTHLVARMRQDPAIGMCGSTIRLYHDRTKVQALGGGLYLRWIGLPWHYGRFSVTGAHEIDQDRAEARMNYVEGASMLVSRAFLDDVGLMAEEYFLYFEETDWAERCRGKYALGYAAQSIVYHKVGGSIGTCSNPMRKSFTCDYYNIRNRIVFALRYYPQTLATIFPILLLECLLRVVFGRFRHAGMILSLMMGRGRNVVVR